jgi:hypothetical protein
MNLRREIGREVALDVVILSSLYSSLALRRNRQRRYARSLGRAASAVHRARFQIDSV